MLKMITTKELEQKVSEGINILDVREVDEFQGGHIPHARNLPLSTLSETMSTLNEAEHYYVICAVGARALRASDYLMQFGFNVTTVSGGMQTWEGEWA